MRMSEIKDLSLTELAAKSRDLRQEVFNLRLQQASSQLEKSSRLRQLRRDVAQVETQLRQLVAAGPADEPALYARYLLARIAHLHRPAESAEIEAVYRDVIAAAPAHPLAQLAAGKLALVLLYQRPDLTVPQRLAGAAALEPVAGAVALPETACAYYRALAEAALYYDVLDARVLVWLQRADALGTRDIMTSSSLRIQLAEVARALGHREAALGYYRQFLATAVPTDNRYRTAAERMAELAKEVP